MKSTLITAISATALLALSACAQEEPVEETTTVDEEIQVDVPEVAATDAPVEMNDPAMQDPATMQDDMATEPMDETMADPATDPID